MENTKYDIRDEIFIGGNWQQGRGETMENEDPYTGETFMKLTAANEEQVDAACASARKAQKKWADMPPAERSQVMTKAATILDERKEEFMEWITREGGGTKIKAATECMLAGSVLREAATLPYMVEGRILPEDIPGKESRMYRQPIGVVGLISPWNFPVQLTARTLGPALAVGNAVVVKPASDTPVTGGLLFAKLFEEAGLPRGVLSVLPGSGSEIGEALIKNPIPRLLSFTGSTSVGKSIGRSVFEGKVIKTLELELGGNGPLVILDDADLDQAVEAAAWGKFMHCGQICMAINRIIVEESIHDEFVERFVEKVRSLKVGDPKDPGTFIGPLVNRDQFSSVMEKIRQAKEEGAECVLEGEPEGLIIPPHVFIGLKPDSVLLKDEIFGPVAPIQKAANEEEALKFANDTSYGLSSAVFTRDEQRGLRFALQMEAGMSHVNDQPVNDSPFSPFGGEKNSGIGRFNGRWAVEAFTTDHWITVQHAPRKYPFSMADLGEEEPVAAEEPEHALTEG